MLSLVCFVVDESLFVLTTSIPISIHSSRVYMVYHGYRHLISLLSPLSSRVYRLHPRTQTRYMIGLISHTSIPAPTKTYRFLHIQHQRPTPHPHNHPSLPPSISHRSTRLKTLPHNKHIISNPDETIQTNSKCPQPQSTTHPTHPSPRSAANSASCSGSSRFV